MTQKIEIDLVPLKLFSRRISEGWTRKPGYPLHMSPDCLSAPNMGSEAYVKRPVLQGFSLVELGYGDTRRPVSGISRSSFSAAVFLRFHFGMPDFPVRKEQG